MAEKSGTWGRAGAAAAFTLAGAAMGTGADFSCSYTTSPVVTPAQPNVSASSPVTVSEALLNAKIDAVEAKVETRFAQVMGKLDTLATEVRNLIARVETNEKRGTSVEGKVQTLSEDMATLKERVSHLPTKGWFVTGSLGIVGALTAVITFGEKLQALVR